MFNYSYKPKWKDLLNFFFINNKLNNVNTLSKIWGKNGKDYIKLFTRSSWIIYFVAFNILKKKRQPATIWLPSYYCDDAVYLLKKINLKIKYYSVDKNFFADKDDLKNLSITDPPDIILFCHFFGNDKYISYLKDLSLKHRAILLEDCTHVIFPNTKIGKYGDISIYSPYKFLPLPHSAIMTSTKDFLLKNKFDFFLNEKNLQNYIIEALSFINFKKKNNFFFLVKWFLKKVLIKLNISYVSFAKFDYDKKIHDYNFLNHPNLDNYSIKILCNYTDSIYLEAEKRIRMQILWKKFLIEKINLEDENFLINNNFNKEVPYFLIIKNLKDKTSKIYNYLIQNKIPVLTWPNLPDEVTNSKFFLKTVYLRNNILFLPLHPQQDLLIKKFKKKNNQNNNIVFEEIFDEKIWQKYYLKCKNPPLPQSWGYGDSQKFFYKIDLKRFLIKEYETKKNLAIIQILYKKFFLFHIYKINRGPIFFENSEEYKQDIINFIFEKFNNLFSLRFLSISPELFFDEKFIFLNSNNKKIYFNPPSWKSMYVNLKLDENLLKQKLNSTWRNQLNASIKNNLKIIEDNSKKNLKNLIDLNDRYAKEKNFKNINKNFLYKFLSSTKYSIFCAYYNNVLVSSICVSKHMPGCTYLIGWSNEEGRKKKSMYLLLWHSIISMKKNKFEFFDLGGYDQDLSNGIYHFKAGIGGCNYQLVGNSNYIRNLWL